MNANRSLVLGFAMASATTLSGCASSPFPYAPPERQGRSWRHATPTRVTAAAPASAAGAAAHRIVLVTLDGVRWQEIFDGVDRDLARNAVPTSEQVDARRLLPNLYRLIDRGAALGHPDARHAVCTANEDHRSLPGFQELFAARPTSCVGNDCGAIECPTFFDHLREHGWERTRAAAFASWPTLRNAFGAAGEWFVTSAGIGPVRTATAEHDVCPDARRVAPIATPPPYRPDAETVRTALATARANDPEFLYVALCDADENAHHADYAHYLASLRAEDEWIGCIDRELAGPHGTRATIIVTTDHGRGYNFHDHGYWAWAPMPESDRTWLVAAGPGIRAAGIIDATRTIYLADVAPTIGALLGWSDSEWNVTTAACSTPTGSPIEELLDRGARRVSRRRGTWRACSRLP